MRLIFTGRGTSGSWQIRGAQLGAAMGATVAPMGPQGDHDLAIVVKRVPVQLLPHLKRWIWDIVDAFPQPASYSWTRAQAIDWLRSEVKRLKPAGIIWPTHRMREDCDPGLPGIVLPHHAKPGLVGNPDPTLIGYEGGEQYLGRWRPLIEREAKRHGMTFMVNPPDFSRLGTVIAVRDGGGYVCQHWKSNVKHANALAIGARFIAHAESGYREQAVGGEAWVDVFDDLPAAFEVAQPLVGKPFTVNDAAAALRGFLATLP